MSEVVTQTKPETAKARTATSPTTIPVKPEQVPLPQVLRNIAEDAQKDPAVYLMETTVPRGGE